jgi:hypothetical protein
LQPHPRHCFPRPQGLCLSLSLKTMADFQLFHQSLNPEIQKRFGAVSRYQERKKGEREMQQRRTTTVRNRVSAEQSGKQKKSPSAFADADADCSIALRLRREGSSPPKSHAVAVSSNWCLLRVSTVDPLPRKSWESRGHYTFCFWR